MTTAIDESTGVKPEDSSTKPDDQEALKPAATPVEDAPESTEPAAGADPAATTKPEGADAAAAKDPKPDPFKAAVLDRFSGKPAKDAEGDEDEEELEQDPAKAEDPAKAADPAAAKPGAKPTEKSKEGQPSPDDPTQGWTEKERLKWQHTPGPVKERLRTLHREHIAAKKELEEIAPVVNAGKTWTGFLDEHKVRDDIKLLSDEQAAWSLKTQAAIVRSVAAVKAGKPVSDEDAATLDLVREGMQALDKALGKASGTGSLDETIKAFKGKIPENIKVLKDLYGELEDDELTLLAAHRAQKEAAKAGKSAEGAPAAATPAKAPAAAPAAPAAAKPAGDPRWSEYELNRASKLMVQDISKTFGIEESKADAFYDANLAAISERLLKQTFPEVKTAAQARAKFYDLSPTDRRALLTDTIAEFQEEQEVKAGKPPGPGRPQVLRANAGAPPTSKPVDLKTKTLARFA